MTHGKMVITAQVETFNNLNQYNLIITCRWPGLCTFVQKFPTVTERQNFVLGSVRLTDGIKKDNRDGCLFLWCRWPDSNRHGIATGGF